MAADQPMPEAPPEIVPADHGLELVETVRPAMLALINPITVPEAQAPIAIPMGYMMLSTVVNNALLEVTGPTVTMFDENDVHVDAQGNTKLRFRLCVPVAWEDDVPPPLRFEEFDDFPCVAYEFTGGAMQIDAMWDKVIAQAMFDGYELTGAVRLEEIEWVGPQSDENIFSMQIGIVP